VLVTLQPRPRAADSELVLAASAGDRAAFGVLYGRYRRMIHGILLAHVSYSDAEDLMQDVFVQAMRRLPGLREPEAFGGWLTAIARHLAVDSHRRHKKTVEVTERNCGITKQDEAEMVMSSIRTLPEAYRETMMLRLVEGMTGPEIAVRCRLTESSVRVNLCRGMKMLREKFGAGGRHG
jgi:RNA polymerase sigma-70 factor, ECF subfamily